MSLPNHALDAFEMIAEAGTMLEASRRLGVTQTALTQRIKLLEQGLAVSLFIRTRRGMVLTEQGEILFRYCRERTKIEGQVIRELRGLSSPTHLRLRLAGPTFQLSRRLALALEHLTDVSQKFLFDLIFDDSNDLLPLVNAGRTDFVLTPQAPPPSLASKELSKAKFVVAIPYAWRNRKARDIVAAEAIIDFNKDDRYTLNFLDTHGLLPKQTPLRSYINNTYQMLALVQAGHGYAVFDHRDVEAKVKSRELALLENGRIFSEQLWFLCWQKTGSVIPTSYQRIIASFQ